MAIVSDALLIARKAEADVRKIVSDLRMMNVISILNLNLTTGMLTEKQNEKLKSDISNYVDALETEKSK